MSFKFAAATTDRIDCGTNVLQSTQRTLAILLTTNAADATGRYLVAFEEDATGEYHLFLDFATSGTNRLEWGFSYGGGLNFPAALWTSGWGAGERHVLVCTYDLVQLAIYADTDPTAKATQAEINVPDTGTHRWLIGYSEEDPNKSAASVIEYVAFWDSVLSEADRLRLGEGRSPLALTVAPARFWRLADREVREHVTDALCTVTGATFQANTKLGSAPPLLAELR